MSEGKVFQSEEKVFQNDRFAQALSICGIKRNNLSAYCDISLPAITSYIKGNRKPTFEVVKRISEYLKVKEMFFYTPKPKLFIRNVAFRKSKTTPKENVIQANELANNLTEIKNNIIDKYVDIPKVNLPIFDYQISLNENSINKGEIENIAIKTREFWNLNNAPISNMIKLCESNGIFVFKFEKTDNLTSKIDAFSWWSDEKPMIFLTKNKTAVRSRFDTAHELGHLILHKNINMDELDDKQQKIIEKEADYFAGCFLLPSRSLIQEYVCHNLQALFNLKRRWKMSVQAIAARLKDLNLIDENQTQYIYKQLSFNHYRQQDPVDNEMQHEEMYLFKEITKTLGDKLDYTNEIMIKNIYNDLGFIKNEINKDNIIQFRRF